MLGCKTEVNQDARPKRCRGCRAVLRVRGFGDGGGIGGGAGRVGGGAGGCAGLRSWDRGWYVGEVARVGSKGRGQRWGLKLLL